MPNYQNQFKSYFQSPIEHPDIFDEALVASGTTLWQWQIPRVFIVVPLSSGRRYALVGGDPYMIKNRHRLDQCGPELLVLPWMQSNVAFSA
jgi:hypothetical protein